MPRMERIEQKLALRCAGEGTIPDHVIALAWSPDGRTVAAASVSGPVVLFDAARCEKRRELAGHGFGTTALSWHPRGHLLASAGQDGMVRLWNVGNGGQDRSLEGGADWIEHVAWSPDGTLLATSAGKGVRLWNPQGVLVRTWGPHRSTVADLAWKPRSLELAVGCYGGVTLYKGSQPAPTRILEWQGSTLALAWSPDGKYLATGEQDNTVHFWMVQSGNDLQMSGYSSKVRALSWDATGRWLATGGSDAPCIWDCSGKGPAGRAPLQMEGFDQPIQALAFQHFGRTLASGDAGGNLQFRQPEMGTEPLGGEALPAGISTLKWAPNDAFLAVGTEEGLVRIFTVGE